MLPAGYLFKRLFPPGDLSGAGVVRVCSAGPCVCDDVVDLDQAWSQNDFGLADTPEQLRALADEQGRSITGAALFYYEIHEQQVVTGGQIEPNGWHSLGRSPGNPAKVLPPDGAELLGFDVVVYGDCLEHSPLSCQAVAGEIPVNQNCLIETLEAAVAAIDSGAFFQCKEGYYRILAVYEVA